MLQKFRRLAFVCWLALCMAIPVLVCLVLLQLSWWITQTQAHEASLAGDTHVVLAAAGQTIGRLKAIEDESLKLLMEQRRYAKATAKAAALATADAGRGINEARAALFVLTDRLVGLENPNAGLLPTAQAAIEDTSKSAQSLMSSAERQVNDTAYETKRVLAAAQENLDQLNRQTIPRANAVLDSTQGAIEDARPGIRSTSEAAESVNQGLAPLRKRAGRIVTALKLIGSYVKATIRLW